jgi:hypothetical protein
MRRYKYAAFLTVSRTYQASIRFCNFQVSFQPKEVSQGNSQFNSLYPQSVFNFSIPPTQMIFTPTLFASLLLSTTLFALPQSDTNFLSLLSPRAGGGGGGGRSSSGSSSSSSSGSRGLGSGSSGRTGSGSLTIWPPNIGEDGDNRASGNSNLTSTRTTSTTHKTGTAISSVSYGMGNGADCIGNAVYLSAFVVAGGVVLVVMF